jgi:hypothetical protein
VLKSPKKPLTPPKKPVDEPSDEKPNTSTKTSPAKIVPTPLKSIKSIPKVAISTPADTDTKAKVSKKDPKKTDPSLKKREAKAAAKDPVILEIRKSKLSQDDEDTVLGKRNKDPNTEDQEDGGTSSVRKSRRI